MHISVETQGFELTEVVEESVRDQLASALRRLRDLRYRQGALPDAESA